MLKRNNINLVYVAIFMLIFKDIVFATSFVSVSNNIYNLITMFSYLFFLFNIFKNIKINKNELFFLTGIGVLVTISSIFLKNTIMLSSFLLYVLAMTTDSKKIMKYISYSLITSIFIVVLLYTYNYIVGNIDRVFEFNGRIRHYFGYSSPNTISFYAIWAYLSYIYIYSDKPKNFILPSILIFILYLFTDSRTMLLIMILSLIILYFSNNKYLRKIVDFGARYGLYIILLFLFTSMYLYKNNFSLGIMLNEILNQRIYLSVKCLDVFGISLIGLKPIDYQQYNIIMDVSYINVICKFGCIYLVLLDFIIRRIRKYGTNVEKSMIIIWMIFAISETAALNFLISFAPLLASKYTSRKKCELYETKPNT